MNFLKKYKMKIIIIVMMVIFFTYYLLISVDDETFYLKSGKITVELGQTVSKKIEDYLDYEKIDKNIFQDIVRYTKEKDDLKYMIEDRQNQDGKIIQKETKYPQVGHYQMSFTYKGKQKTIQIDVKDTTKPTIISPDSIDILQYTDLSTFAFEQLFEVFDYSKLGSWTIDTSKVNMNSVGQYQFKLSICDQYHNEASKTVIINVVEMPDVHAGQVAVTEIVSDMQGHKKTEIKKKLIGNIGPHDFVSTGVPVIQKKGEDMNHQIFTLPVNTKHTHHFLEIKKTVHHDSQTKIIHHDPQTTTQLITVVDQDAYDEPIYETQYICNKCGYSTKDGGQITDHTLDICDSGYHSGKVQIGIQHHDALTHQEEKIIELIPAYDETIVVKEAYDETVVGYQCYCGKKKNK